MPQEVTPCQGRNQNKGPVSRNALWVVRHHREACVPRCGDKRQRGSTLTQGLPHLWKTFILKEIAVTLRLGAKKGHHLVPKAPVLNACFRDRVQTTDWSGAITVARVRGRKEV